TALGVLALLAAPGTVEARDVREVRAQGPSPEALLVNWINECLYVHEIEGYVVARIEMAVFDGLRIHAMLHGEDVDPARHAGGTAVKTATLRGTEIGLRDGRHEARVGLEI